MNKLLAFLVTSWLCSAAAAQAPSPEPHRLLWVGTTNGTIRVFDLTQSGELRLRHETHGPKPLRFLAFHPRLPIVYGSVGKGLQQYQIVKDGSLKPEKAVDAGVRGTHVEVDPAGRFAFLACYGDGALLAFPLDRTGSPGAATFDLRSPEELCRKAHQVRAHKNGRFVYAPCLGDDAVQILEIAAGTVTWRGRVRLATGSGPRHLDFAPTGDHLYVLNELASTVYAYRIDTDSGALTEIQALSALPAGETEGSRSSDIHVSRDGRFVYAVNREPRNEIVTFARRDGRLTSVGRTDTGGSHSRSFALSDDGRFVVIAHSKSRNVVVHSIDAKTGIIGDVVCEREVDAAAIFAGFEPRR